MDRDKNLLIFVGNRVREIRNLRKISQEELGLKSNLDRTYISDIELGKRNVSLLNLHAIAEALEVRVTALLKGYAKEVNSVEKSRVGIYEINKSFNLQCGFSVTAQDVEYAAVMTSTDVEDLPFALFQSINLKTLSGIIGAIFSLTLAERVNAIVNPIEKGHPDIIPKHGKDADEELLRNYPEGLEIKCTVGNVAKGSELEVGQKRLSQLMGITWQAHHREVESLMGLVIDFAGKINNDKSYPVITAVFFSDKLTMEDWGKISGTTGRNTKVTGMTVSGKKKMGKGWVILKKEESYISNYKKLLSFEM